MDLTRLDPYDDHGALRVVVESPRGALLKFAYEPSIELFVVSRGAAARFVEQQRA